MKQPEALRLADITEFNTSQRHPDHSNHVAAELRRLHEMNQELLGALKSLLYKDGGEPAFFIARKAIKKAGGAA